MWIPRDITARLQQSSQLIQILIGPRQCGKSSLLSYISSPSFQEVTLDDFQLRHLANTDPALFLAQHATPLLIEEIQYAPPLFPELKKRVDELKKQHLFSSLPKHSPKVLFRLTGSNQILMDRNVKESLAGRASYYYLNTLTVHEILRVLPETPLDEVLFKGGWPELYTQPTLSPVQYLNDYLLTYVEKDIVLSAGIQKQQAFHTVLGMLAARTGQLMDYSAIAKDSGIQSVTVKEWVAILQRTQLVYLLPPFANNLNKRLTKSPKIYFLDTGLAVRLQGWSEKTPLLNSPQIGHLFETFVFAEIIKYIQNYGKNWKIFVWRTKEGEEIDFLLDLGQNRWFAFDAKLSMHAAQPTPLPSTFKKMFPSVKHLYLITWSRKKLQLSPECIALPITELHDFLSTLPLAN